jgi:para-aminobenzoate synthetase/4-amino-4-deoxychorismate lyase
MIVSRESLHLLAFLLSMFKKEKDCVFLSTQRIDKENYRSFLFLKPISVIKVSDGGKVLPALKKIEDFVNKGFYAAGYLSYEAGLFFEEKLIKKKKFNFPLLWFGIYKEPLIFNHRTSSFGGNTSLLGLKRRDSPLKNQKYKIINPKFSLEQKSYFKCIKRIKSYIEKGDTYQVNFTFKFKFNFYGSSQKLFLDLSSKQSVSYAAFIKHDEQEILSFSPELFFKKEGKEIVVKPMKGTIARGLNIVDDEFKKNILTNSQKDQAENIMIVDLLRNDLGRISKTGTVKPVKIFEIEKYETLFQMTSCIKSTLKSNVDLTQTFTSLFPSGSVTGAPKIKTMQIIQSIEKEPRKIYTGSIGFISPRKECIFNVAIRTILIDRRKRKGEMGIGSGIVYDSNPGAEYAECKLKGNFLTEKAQDFALIETILWKGKFFLLPLHLKRLELSAKYFGFKLDKKKIIDTLKKQAKFLKKGKEYRLRLLLEKNGEVETEATILEPENTKILKVAFSKKKINSQNPFIYHKTTNRNLLDEEYVKCKERGFDEVIFVNEKGQVTEGAISNILIKKNGFFYTPPVSCGLLNGVYRQYLLEKRRLPIKEKVLYKKDLLRADRIYFINSVRGMRKACLS